MLRAFSNIFDRHVALTFIKQTVIVIAVLALMVFIVQFTELATKSTSQNGSTLSAALITLLRLPFSITELTFLSAFIGGMLAMGKLSTNAEATALNALGYSSWRIVIIGALTSAAIAFLLGPVLSPLTAISVRSSNWLEMQNFQRTSTISIFSTKPNYQWLSIETQIDGRQVRVSFRPTSIDKTTQTMENVRFDLFDLSMLPENESVEKQKYFQWMQADHVQITPQKSILRDVWIVEPNQRPKFLSHVELPISPNISVLENGFSAPFELGFFALWNSPKHLKEAGLLSPVHILRLQQLLSFPLLAFGSVMFASIFALRQTKRNRRNIWVTSGYIIGANLFFVYNLTVALSSASIQQAYFTIWLFPLALTLFSIWLLSYLEE